jgi:isoquinoline 1-oxidoreductase beta subunit
MSSTVLTPKLTRRGFVKVGAAGSAALVIGFYLPSLAATQQEGGPSKEAPRINPLNAWIRIGADGNVTLIVGKSEMGQGVMTSLPMILADEVEVDWNSVHVEQAATKPDIYSLGTGGSGSVLDSYLPLRQAGAAARQMLIQAAADTWGVDPASCFAKGGAVIHNPRGHRLAYGELAAKASKLPVPDLKTVVLKNPDNFRYIGTSLPRLDIPSKVDGSAKFGIDVRVPGMLYAVVARCLVFGGKLKSFDAAKAKAVPGVREVVEIPPVEKGAHTAGGIAVVADSTWAAIQGRDALVSAWDNGPHADESTDSLREQLQSLTAKPGKIVRKEGDVEAALAAAANKIEASYELPFLAHATMEPMNCTADVRSNRAEIWAPTQGPDWNQSMVAQVLKLPPKSVVVHTVLMGGGFGRRYQTDFAVEAAQVSKAIGKPVQLLWTRALPSTIAWPRRSTIRAESPLGVTVFRLLPSPNFGARVPISPSRKSAALKFFPTPPRISRSNTRQRNPECRAPGGAPSSKPRAHSPSRASLTNWPPLQRSIHMNIACVCSTNASRCRANCGRKAPRST